MITKKAIEAVAQRMESRVEASLEKSITKMSNLVDSLSTNQKELQGTSATLRATAETLHKAAQDIDSNNREVKDTSTQLTSSVSTYKEALLAVGNAGFATNAHATSRNQEDPRLTRDLERKQRQLLIEFSKDFTEGMSRFVFHVHMFELAS